MRVATATLRVLVEVGCAVGGEAGGIVGPFELGFCGTSTVSVHRVGASYVTVCPFAGWSDDSDRILSALDDSDDDDGDGATGGDRGTAPRPLQERGRRHLRRLPPLGHHSGPAVPGRGRTWPGSPLTTTRSSPGRTPQAVEDEIIALRKVSTATATKPVPRSPPRTCSSAT